MKFKELSIPGLFEIDLFHAEDHRGSFTKTFNKEWFQKHGLDFDFDESFFSINTKGVIRGMHFQLPPHDHSKLVYATHGRILDVVLDIRKDSPTFGMFASIEISHENHKAIYMPKGVAHGFCCLSDATMVYMTSTMHHMESDSGIKWDSFGLSWPVKEPIISDRDQGFDSFSDTKSPF